MTIRALTLVALMLLCSPVLGAGAEPGSGGAADASDWEFDLALYGWLTDMKGDATVGNVRVDVDPQLWNDILRNLDGALFSAFEARYRDRWIFQIDLFGARLSSESESGPYRIGFGPRTIQTGGRRIEGSIPFETRLGTIQIPVARDFAGVRLDIPRVETTVGPIEVETTTVLAQSRLALGYRLFDQSLLELIGREPDDDPRRVALDGFVGIRAWYLKAEVDVESPPIEIPGFSIDPSLVAFPRLELPDVEIDGFTFGGRGLDVSESNWWLDPIVGLRAIVDPCARFRFALAGNVGGFDIGSASKFAWEASAIGFFRLGESWSLGLGYRAQGLERERTGLETDLLIHGPVLGLLIGF
jgi:hypothetical protein